MALDKCDWTPHPSKKYHKKYRAYCNSCLSDRGYLSEDGKGFCYSCAIKFRNKNRDWGHSGAESIYKNGNRRYKSKCPTCGIELFKRSSQLKTDCTSCAATKRNKARYKDSKITSVHRRLRQNIKTQINRALRRRHTSKSGKSTLKMVNYSIDELKKHLENQFQPGMSWDNYGEWHIDHIKPDSLFNYSSYNDQGFLDSWSLENLQPLWKSDNVRKSNKYEG